MTTAHLIRNYKGDCTEGVLVLTEGARLRYACNLLELPDRNNERQKSCIPEGEYEVVPHTSPKFGKCFRVKNVPGREAILIHAGNTVADTLGCLLPGTYASPGRVSGSRVALADLLALAPKGFRLKISKA